jgi:Na+/melibiose symporter-like transporter
LIRYWSHTDLAPFHSFVTAVSVICACVFISSFVVVKNSFLNAPSAKVSCDEARVRDAPEFLTAVKQLLRSKNFVCYVGFSALQVFECTFEKNFLNLFLDELLGPQHVAPRGMFIVVSFVLPHLLVVAVTPLVQRVGCYRIISYVVALKLFTHVLVVIASLLYASHGALPPHSTSAFLASAFLVFARVLTEMTCRLSPLVMSNIVDEDTQMHSRSRPMSALVMGVQSFLVKPGQSLAPMLGWWLFALGGGQSGQQAEVNPLYVYVIFAPCACCVMQLLLWRKFDLHGKKLQLIQKSWGQA